MKTMVRALATVLAVAYGQSPGLAALSLLLVPLGAVTQLNALWLKHLADAVTRQDAGIAVRAAILIAITSTVASIVVWQGADVRLTLTERIAFALQRRLAELDASLPGLEHHERPEYIDRLELVRGQERPLAALMQTLTGNLTNVVQAVLALVLLASIHPLLVVLPVFSVPTILSTAAAQRRSRRVEEATTEQVRLSGELMWLSRAAEPAKELRVFNLEDEIVRRHGEAWTWVRRQRQRAEWESSAQRTGASILSSAGSVLAVVFIALRAAQGRASAGDLLMAITVSRRVTGYVSSAIGGFGSMSGSLRTAERFLWLVDYAAAIRRARHADRSVPAELHDGIVFEDVSFRYPGTEPWVLRDVNLRVPAGTVVAIVGENGAGKTTLVKLLCGFYDPTRGRITVDGSDLLRFDHEAWRARLSAGFQDFAKLELVARETVGVGDLPRIEEEPAVLEALSRAGASDVVGVLTHGLETQLGRQWEGGAELSVGQWQKLALGRALMRDEPLLLVLDEPTSSLDAQTEHSLFQRFSNQSASGRSRGALTVLVSHRFSTVRMADLIVVVDKGRIVEQGTHEELIERKGLYAELYALQAASYR